MSVVCAAHHRSARLAATAEHYTKHEGVCLHTSRTSVIAHTVHPAYLAMLPWVVQETLVYP